jgi:predicted NAD/FAD-dependent oxidoreductase
VATQLLAGQPQSAPPWLGAVRYAPAVRVYAARRCADDANFGVHVVPPRTVVTVECYAGRRGAWGACPADWQWGLVSAPGVESGALLERPDEEVTDALWAAGRAVQPKLFPLEQAEVVHLMRWPWALPIMGPGHYTRLAAWRQRPPLVLAGDWTQEACVEGAVRSGEAAAAVFAP